MKSIIINISDDRLKELRQEILDNIREQGRGALCTHVITECETFASYVLDAINNEQSEIDIM